jgi:hypothetical protein
MPELLMFEVTLVGVVARDGAERRPEVPPAVASAFT